MPLFERYVEAGRLCRITYGADAGKMCTIIDIIDEKRMLVDGPVSVTGVERQQLPIKWLSLTDLKADLYRGAKAKTLKAALKSGDVLGKWEKSAWGNRIAMKAKKDNLSDFERFRVMVAKKKKASLVAKKIKK